ncbi:MAG: cytochrome c oxidase subunit II [Deltaproteobacteria bacterium]|nr:cytochrome c oxidase subunit II [Deltaproteobacteria bacterium]
MSIQTLQEGWFKAPVGAERAWIGIAFAWCMVMTVAMPYWHFYGKQNATGESYRVTPIEYTQRVAKFIETYQTGEISGFPIVEPPPGADAYLQAQMWKWTPVLKLKKGQSYRLHISSLDLNHGFSIQPVNMSFQVLPGYDHVLTLTPTSAGEFSIVCNEFCGIGHHLMTGRILVTE